ncbi:putative membrane protein [Leptospira wolbachii serovar Codice str. CDC]|uniref:Membrane protein n=2 Tax=Leptospira TaxID=171 RepID=R9A5J1_9LEPT|nr:putative membrane protein [Leptospira wolbachii serovar Codice str. CDC]
MNSEQGIDLTLLLWNSAITILAVALVCYLASFRQTILFMLTMVFAMLAGIQFTCDPHHDPIEIMGFIKLMLLLPLGLGAVLAFSSFSEDRQQRFLLWFSHYINFAVVANIFVMVFTPGGDTYRGLLSRIVCLTLLVWLLQEMAKERFQTTLFDRRFFIFRSSPLQWVYCHAAYRLALLSLPTFDSLQYLLLEPMSLFIMFVLYRLHKKRYVLNYYFGFADTLVVTTLTVLARYPVLPPFELKGPYLSNLTQNQWDMVFIPIQLIVISFALRAMFKNLHTPKTSIE